MIVVLSYLSLPLLLAASAWIAWVRGRGAINYWVRPVKRKEAWAVGIELGASDPAADDPRRLAEVVALVRTLDRESGHVVRGWDREKGTRFIGLVMEQPPETEPAAPFRMRRIPAGAVLRVSGKADTEGRTAVDAAKEFLSRNGLQADLARPRRVSGQSFSFFEWELPDGGDFPTEPLSERVFRMRDIVLYPLVMTAFSIALLGTGSGALFATGLLLIIFLSGACKFVFVHQREDESQESHLQNY